MDSGHPAQDDILQVIPRRAPSTPSLVSGSTGRIWLPPPARKRRLTRVVVATVGACGLILVAAGIVHMARGKDASAFEATGATSAAVAAVVPTSPTTAAPTVAPAAPAAPPVPAEPQSGTVTLQRPASAGHVWLDGQKLNAASATVPCGKHQVKIGAHGRAHAIDVPCGGEVHVSR